MSIKDSGERTEFTTGAQRDMHAGKGRFDLLPWHAIHDVAKHCEEGVITLPPSHRRPDGLRRARKADHRS